MNFGANCQLSYHHDKELLEVVRSFPVRGF